ncbi:hypothetical protein [Sorangium sp. So ce1024]|uniref:hypothetical protein n=1 Tax=Sorangium sp. So ce1024 TaxID=3133327 RepID=UPI003EFE56F9
MSLDVGKGERSAAPSSRARASRRGRCFGLGGALLACGDSGPVDRVLARAFWCDGREAASLAPAQVLVLSPSLQRRSALRPPRRLPSTRVEGQR